MTVTDAPVSGAPDQRTQRQPPYDLFAERSVIGAMLLSKDVLADVLEHVRAEDFYQPRNATIVAIAARMAGEGEIVDAVTLAHALDKAQELNRVGGAPYLHECINTVPSVGNGVYYAKIVAEHAALRGVIKAGDEILQLGYSAVPTGQTADDVVDRVQGLVYALDRQHGATEGGAMLADLLQPTLDDIEGNADPANTAGKVRTGFTDLDRLMAGGMTPGQLILVGGRPGMGKSTAVLDFARHAVFRQGIPTMFFSLEMSKIQVITRLLSAEARVPLHALKSGQLTDEMWTKLARCMGETAEAPLWVDDYADQTLMSIRSRSRRFGLRRDVGDVGLIVLDYLQLLESGMRAESRQVEVSQISRGLKKLGKATGAAVVAACQLNRDADGKRPNLSELRESGSLEQDADMVILLHRDDYYDKESPKAGECDFIVAKHRDGPTDTITVAAQLHMSRFVDMAIS